MNLSKIRRIVRRLDGPSHLSGFRRGATNRKAVYPGRQGWIYIQSSTTCIASTRYYVESATALSSSRPGIEGRRNIRPSTPAVKEYLCNPRQPRIESSVAVATVGGHRFLVEGRQFIEARLPPVKDNLEIRCSQVPPPFAGVEYEGEPDSLQHADRRREATSRYLKKTQVFPSLLQGREVTLHRGPVNLESYP